MGLGPLQGNPLENTSFSEIIKILCKYSVFGSRAPSRDHQEPPRTFKDLTRTTKILPRMLWRPPPGFPRTGPVNSVNKNTNQLTNVKRNQNKIERHENNRNTETSGCAVSGALGLTGSPKEATRTSQGTPGSHQECPDDPPRLHKKTSRIPRRASRGTQEAPRGPPSEENVR